MKKIYLLAAAAAFFAACSSNDDLVNENQVAQAQEAGELPVNFDSYVNRGTTRAGLKDADVVIGDLQVAKVGFGVFGYYTNADNYDQSFTPNFMYNEHIYWNAGEWDYSPVKYWPNEFGTNAASDDADKVSFFAYAPYISVNWTTGKPNGTGDGSTYHTDDDGDTTMGIVGMKKNTDTGDPMVKYISTFYTNKQVDLMWGTQTGDWNIKQTNAAQTFTVGEPWLNVQHPQGTSTTWPTAQKVKFDFKHALAKLNVQVDTKVNNTSPASVGGTEPTKVFIRSVTFEGFDTKGALNLNNHEAGDGIAVWYNFDCADELNNGAEVTIKDGRKDGKEGLTAATKEYAAINPTFVQDKVFDSAENGVTGVPGNLFCSLSATSTPDVPTDKTDPILVIPNGDPLKVTIEYDVLTKDINLFNTLNDGVTPGSVVKNVITRYITTDGKGSVIPDDGTKTYITLENGKKYTINLHLGLNSVEFDADVTPWAASETGGADLPHNNVNVGAAGGSVSITFPGATGTVSITSGGITGMSCSNTGEAVTVTVPTNSTVTNQTYNLTLTDSGTSNTLNVTITQAAAALGLTVTDLTNSEKDDITLGQTATGGDWTTATVSITKNGTLMIHGTDYTWDSSTKIIHLSTEAVNGETYAVTVSGMGNAAAETKTVTNSISAP